MCIVIRERNASSADASPLTTLASMSAALKITTAEKVNAINKLICHPKKSANHSVSNRLKSSVEKKCIGSACWINTRVTSAASTGTVSLKITRVSVRPAQTRAYSLSTRPAASGAQESATRKKTAWTEFARFYSIVMPFKMPKTATETATVRRGRSAPVTSASIEETSSIICPRRPRPRALG